MAAEEGTAIQTLENPVSSEKDGVVYLQAHFVTKQENLNIPTTPLSIPASANYDDLNELVKQLTESSYFDERASFDFLINRVLLRVPLEEFVQEHHIETEHVLEIECVLREPAPTPDLDLPHEDWVSAVKATSSKIISASFDGSVRVWSLKGENTLTFQGHAESAKCLCVLSDGSGDVQFVTGSQDQTLMLWEYKENEATCSQVYKGHERSVECVCCNRDGTRLASGGFDGYLKVWSTEDPLPEELLMGVDGRTAKKRRTDGSFATKTPMVTLAGHREAVMGVDWCQNPAEAVTVSLDQSIIVWDLELAGQKMSLASDRAFTAVSYSQLNGSVITGSVDRHVRLWDPRSKEGSLVKSTFTSHAGWVSCVNWSKTKENLFVSGSYDNMLKLWDTRSPKAPLYDMAGHKDRILCCDWSVPGLIASGGVDASVKTFGHRV